MEELARALTGWRYNNVGITLPNSNWLNVTSPMVSEFNPNLHDSGSKTIMGVTIKAGLNASKILMPSLDLLMKHPNTAPFVSLRLIQHLVTSNPSPAYITASRQSSETMVMVSLVTSKQWCGAIPIGPGGTSRGSNQ